MNRFDIEALTWDDLPRRVNLAKDVVKNILPYLKGDEKVLDFGCGTGLIGINLAYYVQEVVGIDTSKNMVDIFNKKARKLNLSTIAYQKDIFEVHEKFDVVVSSMTLHHIKDIKALSKHLFNITGNVFIADLCKEDGSFHDRGNDGVYHFGFSEEELNNYFSNWKRNYKIIHTVKKQKDYDIFLLHLYKN